MITRTSTGHEVSEEVLSARFALVREVKDFRLEQLSEDSYRVIILPERNSDIRGLRGSVLDVLVDVYGIKARYEIDINELDEELLPVVNVKDKAVNKCGGGESNSHDT